MQEYGNNRTAAETDRGGHRRPFQSVAATGVRRRRAQHSRPRWSFGRDCWRWRLLLNLAELVVRKWKGVLEALHLSGPKEAFGD